MSAIMQKIDNCRFRRGKSDQEFTGDKLIICFGLFTDFMKANKEPLSSMIANWQGFRQIRKGTVGKLIYDESLY